MADITASDQLCAELDLELMDLYGYIEPEWESVPLELAIPMFRLAFIAGINFSTDLHKNPTPLKQARMRHLNALAKASVREQSA